MSKKIKAIEDLTPDDKNANKGTERGRALLEKSIRRLGAGRSILVDKDGRVIAGNKTIEAAVESGLEIEVVETTGDKLVVVQRVDLDLDSAEGREMAVADNRVGQVGLEFDGDILEGLLDDGVPVAEYFTEAELRKLIDGETEKEQETLLDQAVQLTPAREYVVIMCQDDGGEEFERLRMALDLQQVRRGGFRKGSSLDETACERVIPASRVLDIIRGE